MDTPLPHPSLARQGRPAPRRFIAHPWLGLAGWLALCLLAALAGVAASRESSSIYLLLERPAWAPPAAVFGPVWSVLYVLMAVAAWQVWRARGWAQAGGALTLFVVQLVANALWTWLFFAWRSGPLAFADIVLLWLLVAATTAAFWRVRPSAGAMLLPYLLWVSFAAVLNWSIWQRNPEVLG